MTRLGDHWLTPPREKRLQGGAWVYRFFDDEDVLLYVGIAKNLPKRFQEHLRSLSTPNWGNLEVVGFTARWYPRRVEAEFAEAKAIVFEAPIFNGSQSATLAGRDLFNHKLADRRHWQRERIRGRLGADPGKWAYVRHDLEGCAWKGLAVDLMRRTGRCCHPGQLHAWAAEYGPVQPYVWTSIVVPITLAEVRPGAQLLLSQIGKRERRAAA